MINTFGLGISLACCITAYLLVAYNLEFDDFYDDDAVSTIFRVHTSFNRPEGGIGQHVNAPINLGPSMASDLTGVKMYTRFIGDGGAVNYGDLSLIHI